MTISTSNKRSATGTKEWAEKNLNIYSGCSNDCKYCYAKSMAIRFKRKTSFNWYNEILDEKKLNEKFKKIDGRFMFPTAHDITPKTLKAYSFVLKRMLESGNEVLIVSKPYFDCIKSICDEFVDYKKQITFRFSIGSSSSDTLKFWEPNAPGFEERLAALKYAFESGYKTSVSTEPFLDDNVEDLIEKVKPWVNDSIWIGKINQMGVHLSNNGHTDTITKLEAEKLKGLYDSDYKYKLYNIYGRDATIKWKDSLKKDFGIALVTKSGADI